MSDYSFKPSEVTVNYLRDTPIGGMQVPSVCKGVKVTHIKSGIVTTCESERSQHKNRHLAFLMLESKLKEFEDE